MDIFSQNYKSQIIHLMKEQLSEEKRVLLKLVQANGGNYYNELTYHDMQILPQVLTTVLAYLCPWKQACFQMRRPKQTILAAL